MEIAPRRKVKIEWHRLGVPDEDNEERGPSLNLLRARPDVGDPERILFVHLESYTGKHRIDAFELAWVLRRLDQEL